MKHSHLLGRIHVPPLLQSVSHRSVMSDTQNYDLVSETSFYYYIKLTKYVASINSYILSCTFMCL